MIERNQHKQWEAARRRQLFNFSSSALLMENRENSVLFRDCFAPFVLPGKKYLLLLVYDFFALTAFCDMNKQYNRRNWIFIWIKLEYKYDMFREFLWNKKQRLERQKERREHKLLLWFAGLQYYQYYYIECTACENGNWKQFTRNSGIVSRLLIWHSAN